MSARPLALRFKDVDKRDLPSVGGKGANLGEMVKAHFPVPDGFAVTVEAYELFLKQNDLPPKIFPILAKANIDNPEELAQVSRTLQGIIKRSVIPEEVVRETVKFYRKLSGIMRHALVAVRSSATAEDLPSASFAGQQATFLNIKGESSLLEAVRDCWASLFTPRAIFYRRENKIDHEKVKISVIVQKMIQSVSSGVMFTVEPVTNEKDKIVIEAVWGLGEMIVQGSVVPDKYVVQKETFAILSKEISDQPVELVKEGHVTKERAVPQKKRGVQKISDQEVIKLARIADSLQKHYYFPQDVEWAKDPKGLYIVQTRPVTTMGPSSSTTKVPEDIKTGQTPVLIGTPASPGIATGPVKILKSSKEIAKIQKGDILVAPMTSPDFVPAMKKAAAIITDEGGQTSHAAIVSRELGIPCIVGTKEATKKLTEAMSVSVDGAKGEIYLGSKVVTVEVSKGKERIIKSKTATNLYVNLAEPERAGEISKLNVDGVGLLRAEFMIANIGIHPKEAIKRKTQKQFVEKLTKDISVFCQAFSPRSVVYRATDFKTNEYRALSGGKYWEPEEPNPMLGFRGAFRYVADPEVFSLELKAISKVREKYNNLNLMIPFVRSPEELAKVRRLVATEGLFEKLSFKFWMMVELPVNVILLEEFIKVGIDGVSIGSNDLTMLISGTDRDNSEVAPAFNERSPAVSWALKKIITTCNKNGITSSICGQAPSQYDDLVEELVNWGITSISVNPDAINRVRRVIMDAERKLANG